MRRPWTARGADTMELVMGTVGVALAWIFVGLLFGCVTGWLLCLRFGRHRARMKSLEMEANLVPGLRAQIDELESRPPTIIEKPVVKMIDRPVDNTALMNRIQSLEKETTMIPGLRSKIADLESRPPKVIEKPVERAVDNPAHLARIRELEGDLQEVSALRARIDDLEQRPPAVVDRLVDNPEHIARIRRLEEEASVIPELRATIAALRQRPPEIVEKPVEKIVERLADNPVHVAKIRMLEKDAALLPALRSRIADLEARAAKFDAYSRPVERIIERLVPDPRASEESDRRLKDLERRFEALERALGRGDPEPESDETRAEPGAVDVAAARAEGFNMWGPDDLRVLSGLDDEAADILSVAGASTFSIVAEMTPAEIGQVLTSNGYALSAPVERWPEEAALVLRNDWRALRELQQDSADGR